MEKRVLLVNPWAVNNDSYYTSGFISGMNEVVDIDVITNYYYSGTKPNGNLWPIFFKKSEKLPIGLKRKIIRGIEYCIAWMRIVKLIKSGHYNVVHFHWLLLYKVDLFFLRKIQKKCGLLVLTAHNVLPHVNGEKYIDVQRKIYECFGCILVHGESIKKEFSLYFPEFVDKVKIQFHGEYYHQSTEYCESREKDYLSIKQFISKYPKYYIMFGNQFYNKGTDLLLSIWRETFFDSQSGLIIAGQHSGNYTELENEISKIHEINNVLYIDHYLSDNALNFAIDQSSCIILPYRHASMSGVVYTAAEFSKMLLCTNSGAIAEYLESGVDSLVCGCQEEEIRKAIQKLEELSQEELIGMGEKLTKNIHNKYSWKDITKKLVTDIFEEERK